MGYLMTRSGLSALALALVAMSLLGGSQCASPNPPPPPPPDEGMALTDLGAQLYLDLYEGGLYPGNSNEAPAEHHAEGVARASDIQPLNTNGQPDAAGKYVFLSIGMSNTRSEFEQFVMDSAGDSEVNHEELVVVNGAANSQTAPAWTSPDHPNYDRIRDDVLAPLDLSEAQVRVVWLKVANRMPETSLPDPDADAFVLLEQLGEIVRTLGTRYPNLSMVFLSSRIYGGYATTDLNPEPYAFESGFAVKWLIEAQIRQVAGEGVDPAAGDLDYTDGVPWLAWGPYLWADGLDARSDGLVWEPEDFAADGTHPSHLGEEKVSDLLLEHFLVSPYGAPWFRGG